MSPYIFAGLGNPGPRYRETRHNVGFLVLDILGERLGLRWKKPLFSSMLIAGGGKTAGGTRLVKPLTWMNRSGDIFPALRKKWNFDTGSLVVVCDNLDLPPGMIRIKKGGSSAGHNGLKSLAAALGSGSFVRVYVGIGRPGSGTVVEHVLGVPAGEEAGAIAEGIGLAAEACGALAGGETVESVMGRFNRRNSEKSD